MKDYNELNVWKKSHELARKVYHVTSIFPREELYGLTSQISPLCQYS
ncbi:MAG: four helix bundle protein [Candidatus Omnitrophica bacterium]|nr:four helix bundle protein [Candidatus Omnitrophota bacterium]